MNRRSLLVASLLVASMWVGGTLASTSFAQKASVPKQPDTAAIAREKVTELLALMDTDKNGKISKQEWMKFMEAEFDRLDTKKKGEIDPKEVLHSSVSVGRVRTSAVGK
jgi:CRISPR/Cas system-associated endonuclease Cas3-HD